MQVLLRWPEVSENCRNYCSDKQFLIYRNARAKANKIAPARAFLSICYYAQILAILIIEICDNNLFNLKKRTKAC